MNENILINDEITLGDLLSKLKLQISILTKYKNLIIGITLIGIVLGFSIAKYTKTKYKAELTFAFEDENGSGGISGALGIASSLGIGVTSGNGGIFSSSNITELIKSRLIVEKTLLKPIIINNSNTTLLSYYVQNSKINLNEKFGINSKIFLTSKKRKEFSIDENIILENIYKELILDEDKFQVIQKDKRYSIFNIDIVNDDELFAKMFCESLAEEVSNFYIDTKSRKAKINYEILKKQTDSVRNELNQSILNTSKSTDNIFNLNPSLNIKSAPIRQRQVDVQANTAILTQLVAQLELSKVNLRKETPLIQIIDSPFLPLNKIAPSKITYSIIGALVAFILASFLILILKGKHLNEQLIWK